MVEDEMPEEEYALVPQKEFFKLKRDVEAIKKNPLTGLGGEDLIASINELRNAINNLLELFKTAAEEIKLEQRESETIAQKLDPLFSKIDEIVEQNKKLAKGLVAIADLVSEIKSGKQAPPVQQKPVSPQALTPAPAITQKPLPPIPSTAIMPKPLPPPPIAKISPTQPTEQTKGAPLPPPPAPQKKKWLF